MFKYVSKVMDKLYLPVLLLNMAAVGAIFYNRGKVDAIVELNTAKETEETEAV